MCVFITIKCCERTVNSFIKSVPQGTCVRALGRKASVEEVAFLLRFEG